MNLDKQKEIERSAEKDKIEMLKESKGDSGEKGLELLDSN